MCLFLTLRQLAVHLRTNGSGALDWGCELTMKSLGSLENWKFIDFLSFLHFFIVSLILLECMINLSTSANCFLKSFLDLTFSLSSLIFSKIYLFSSLIFYANCLCLLKWGTLNPIMLLDFRLSISYIFLTKERFYKMTGSMFSLQMTLAFLYLEICNA
jgi:hypothetical protein